MAPVTLERREADPALRGGLQAPGTVVEEAVVMAQEAMDSGAEEMEVHPASAVVQTEVAEVHLGVRLDPHTVREALPDHRLVASGHPLEGLGMAIPTAREIPESRKQNP